MSDAINRRTFLSSTAATAVGLSAAQLLAADAKLYGVTTNEEPGPSETVNVGLIGCGTRGGQWLDVLPNLPGVRVVAVCDVNSKRLAENRSKAGGDKVAAYHDYRKMLDDKQVDAVLVATNGQWKALCSIDACRAGKDVYVEKPLATSIGEGRAIVEAAKKHKRIVQIGTQQHSVDHYRKAVEIIQSGRLGTIGEVKVWDYTNYTPGIGAPPDGDPPAELDWDFWLGPTPKVAYNPNRYNNHYWFFDYGGGWVTDWAVHHYDIVNWAMGAGPPLAAYGSGGHYYFSRKKDNREWPDTFSGSLDFGPCPAAENGFVLQYTARLGNQHGNYPLSNGKCFYGTDATLLVHRGGYWLTPEIRASKKVEKETLNCGGTGDMQFYNDSSAKHFTVFLNNLRNRTQPETSAEVGHRASIPGHLMNVAWRVGRKVHWDADVEKIVNDPEADAMVTRQYREPWKLEV